MGPTSNGFDYFFGISASLDMAPYAFIENDRFTESPTAEKSLLVINGNEAQRRGPAAPGFESVQMLPALARKSAEWIAAHRDEPFLLYLSSEFTAYAARPGRDVEGQERLGRLR